MPALPALALERVAKLRGADARMLHVLDVGANPIEGEASYRALVDAGLARVTGFEPQPEAFARLAAMQGPRETYRPEAVGDGAPATLRLTRSGGFASVFEPDARAAALLGWGRGMRVMERLAVATVRLDDLDLGGPVDFLKIDVQGAELGIIRHGRATLAGTLAVQTEVRFLPIYLDEPRFGALDAELHAQGFAFHDFLHLKRVPFAGPRAGRLRRRAARQVVDGDAVYLRALHGAAGWDDDALLRLALLALGVFDSPTVAVHCLDLLAQRGACTVAQVDAVIDALPQALRAEVEA